MQLQSEHDIRFDSLQLLGSAEASPKLVMRAQYGVLERHLFQNNTEKSTNQMTISAGKRELLVVIGANLRTLKKAGRTDTFKSCIAL